MPLTITAARVTVALSPSTTTETLVTIITIARGTVVVLRPTREQRLLSALASVRLPWPVQSLWFDRGPKTPAKDVVAPVIGMDRPRPPRIHKASLPVTN